MPERSYSRESKYSAVLTERICMLIRAGNTIEVAAAAVGLSPNTVWQWLQRRKDFKAAVDTARGEAETILVMQVQRAAGQGSWRAACWLLERQWPERWAALSDRAQADRELDHELDRILAK